ncbi:astacin [Ancylostoma ceylanicum]|uniref:Metalloendopeptidase n=1 Tax=Ancylostoma ceylanicum TaxID=53326 RepID=A0A0D6LYN3_9BILA|nr:astacin [Ancylostoma ceylanicum]
MTIRMPLFWEFANFKKAAAAWAKSTCLNIVEDKNAEDKIQVMRGPSCLSAVGRQGKTQGIWIADNCMTVGSIEHELGHALGLIHTHERHDRDTYIDIIKDNIQQQYRSEFGKETSERTNSYEIPYEYGSIMHYNAYGFAIDKTKPVIVPKQDEKYTRTLGGRILSFLDLLTVNKHYDCLGKCGNSIQCANEGFQNPKNCSECVCPTGYGGPTCDKRAPAGKKVEVKLLNLKNWANMHGCTLAGVEIKAQADQRHTGYRFCSPEDKGVTLVSSGKRLPVIIYNTGTAFEVTIEYKAV